MIWKLIRHALPDIIRATILGLFFWVITVVFLLRYTNGLIFPLPRTEYHAYGLIFFWGQVLTPSAILFSLMKYAEPKHRRVRMFSCLPVSSFHIGLTIFAVVLFYYLLFLSLWLIVITNLATPLPVKYLWLWLFLHGSFFLMFTGGLNYFEARIHGGKVRTLMRIAGWSVWFIFILGSCADELLPKALIGNGFDMENLVMTTPAGAISINVLVLLGLGLYLVLFRNRKSYLE